jgi:MscS family membrane protein
MKNTFLFAILLTAYFAINLDLSAQISPNMAKKAMAAEDQKEQKDATEKVSTGEKVEITVPQGARHTSIKGEFHGVLIQDGHGETLPASSDNKEKKAVTNEKGSDVLDDKAIENLATNPLDTIWGSFKSWVSSHIELQKIDLWKVGYLFIGILITLITGRVLRWVIEHHFVKLSSKTNTEVDDRVCEAVGRPVALFVFAVGVYLSSGPIISHLSPSLKSIFGRLCLATAAAAVAWALYRLISVIDYILTKLAARTDNNLDDLIVAIIRKSLKVTVILLSVLFIGQNILDMNITALLAGAGVMGLAIAFAAQDTIANFFGSIMIILDQPFKVGDCIQVSGFKGSVENVGFRSTRIRTFDGHLVSLPNKGVANNSIENIAKRPFIKHTINLGLTYDTGYKSMEKAMKILHKLLDEQKCMDEERLPRIVFDKFNDFSLNISVTVWWHFRDEEGNIIAPDYGEFMKWVHATDMEILKQFDEAGLDFAFPTNTTYLAYDEKRKLTVDVNSK